MTREELLSHSFLVRNKQDISRFFAFIRKQVPGIKWASEHELEAYEIPNLPRYLTVARDPFHRLENDLCLCFASNYSPRTKLPPSTYTLGQLDLFEEL